MAFGGVSSRPSGLSNDLLITFLAKLIISSITVNELVNLVTTSERRKNYGRNYTSLHKRKMSLLSQQILFKRLK